MIWDALYVYDLFVCNVVKHLRQKTDIRSSIFVVFDPRVVKLKVSQSQTRQG